MDAHEQNRTFQTGAVRDGGKKPSLQYISPHAMFRLGEWLRFACEDRKPHPYAPRNWEKGMPMSECVASLQRHVEKFKLGDTSEDHLAAILFGGMALCHYEEEIKAGRLPASLDDMPHYITRPGTVEAKVQATLDKTFGEGVFAAEDIPAGAPVKIKAPHTNIRCPSCKCYTSTVEGQCCIECADKDLMFGKIVGKGPIQEVTYVNDSPTMPVFHARDTKPFTVYLCGPITGVTRDYDWRYEATQYLTNHGIRTLNPLRGKTPEYISNDGLSYKGQLASPEIADRDRMDIDEADVILAHFPYDPPRQSIGSLMEMGMAHAKGKPVVLCTSLKTFNDHLFCRNFCVIMQDFDKALEYIAHNNWRK